MAGYLAGCNRERCHGLSARSSQCSGETGPAAPPTLQRHCWVRGLLTSSETYARADGSLADVSMLDGDQMMVAPGVRIIEMADGWIAVSAGDDDQIKRLCHAAGIPDPSDLPRVPRTLPSEPFLSVLTEHDVSATAVRREQRYPFFDDPANQAAGMVASYRHGEWGWLE